MILFSILLKKAKMTLEMDLLSKIGNRESINTITYKSHKLIDNNLTNERKDLLSFLARLFRQKKQFKIAVVGLDSAGKTTMLNFLRFERNIETLPTIGVNVEVLQRENVNLSIFDLGGQQHFRNLWGTLMRGASAIIFVIDSSDRARLNEANNELWNVLMDPQFPDAPLLVVANKQDKEGAMNIEELIKACNLDNLEKMGNRSWHIQPTVATTGVGVEEAIKWIVMELDKL